jgi:predicted dehydrogenase
MKKLSAHDAAALPASRVAPISVAVLGAGGMGCTVIGHLKECKAVGRIVAYDVDAKRLDQVRQSERVDAAADLGGVLSDGSIPLVFIAASNDAHKDLTIKSLAAGKAVMCEKPMAISVADATAMVEAAERRHGFLQIGFELRYSRLYTRIKEWIDAGLLGRVVNTNCYYVTSCWSKKEWRVKKDACGNMFGEKLSHYVDLPRWWIGAPVEEVASYCAPNTVPYMEVRDNYQTSYRFTGGAVSHLTFMMGPPATFRGDPLQNFVSQQIGDGHNLRYLVAGASGSAEADVFARTIKRWEYVDGPEYMESNLVETVKWDAAEDHVYFHNTRDQTHDIVRRVIEGLPPATSPRDSLETMRLCFAAERSAELGRPVRLDEMLEL